MENNDAIREQILKEGAKAMEAEIEKNVNQVISENEKRWKLPIRDILSTSTMANKDLPASVKKQIEDCRLNLRKIIAGTASVIEKNKFSTVAQAIKKVDLFEHDKTKVINFFDAQQKLSYSFQTLSVTIELFTQVNDDIKKEIETLNKTDKSKTLKLRLINAVLVYELTDFVTYFVENFALVGREAINEIKNIVFKDLERGEKEDKQLQSNLHSGRPEIMKIILRDINEREKVRKIIKDKWIAFESKIDEMENSVSNAMAVIPDLVNIRENAKNQIDTLSLVAIMQIIETNIEIVKSFPELTKNLLVPFSAEDACQILGIDVENK